METGIGPAIRVLRHFIERRSYYQLKFSSGEQALVLIAGMPAPSVEVVRLAFGGLIPWQTVWEYNPTRAGGYSDYIHKLKAMFSPARERASDAVDHIGDVLASCRSIEDARTLLLQRERIADGLTNETADDLTTSVQRMGGGTGQWEMGSPYPRPISSVEMLKPAATIHNTVHPRGDSAERTLAENVVRSEPRAMPHRYRISQDAGMRFLTCTEAPSVMVRVERGLSISAKEARTYRAGTIFLDGAAQGEPFIDVERELYNLNHPEACIRSLATCEQAMILIHKRLDPRKRDWWVLANDSDLDTVLAIWVVLNHLRLNADPQLRDRVMPLLRLEGVIDAHGPEWRFLSALPLDLLRSTAEVRKQLQQQEVILKNYGRWEETDLLEYVADRLQAIDAMIYSPENFADLLEVDELARGEIANRSVAVVCSSAAAIDQVQRQLQRTYGERLGILIFQVAASTYDVRQVDSNLTPKLGQAYERLNLLDPAATSGAENRWGGSAEIGHSPRKTGTHLTPVQIIEAVCETFSKTNFFTVVSELPRAGLLAGGSLLPVLALIFIGNLLRDRGYVAAAAASLPLSALILTGTVVILFFKKARLVPGLYGWRIPTGTAWLATLFPALLGGAIGGAWGSGSLAYRIGSGDLYRYQFTGLTLLLLSLAAELLFRGLIFGNLAARLPIQRRAGFRSWSWPNLITAALYALASLLLFLTITWGGPQIVQSFLIVVGAVTFGISSGMARERSESVLPCVLLHWICTAVLFLSYRLLS